MAFNPTQVIAKKAHRAAAYDPAALESAGLHVKSGAVRPTITGISRLLRRLYGFDELCFNTDVSEIQFGDDHGDDAITQLIQDLETITGVIGWHEKKSMIEDAVRLRHRSPHADFIMKVPKDLPRADLSPWTSRAADPEFADEAIRMMAYGYVARAFKPGFKFDYAIFLVGRQGIGKTTLLDDLFPGRAAGYEFDDKRPSETAAQHERIVLEEAIDELFRHERFSRLKDRISLTERGDDVKYVRGRQQMKARAIFTGSSNEYLLLTPNLDGTRRFLIVLFRKDVTDFMPRMTHEVWEQLISEGLRRYDADEAPVLSPEGSERQQDAIQMVTRPDEDTDLLRFHVQALLDGKGWFQKAELQEAVFEADMNLKGRTFTTAWRKLQGDYQQVKQRVEGRSTTVFVPRDDVA